MGTKLRVAVLGAGRIGRLHIGHLSQRIPGVVVTVVADVIAAAAEKCAADFSIPSVSNDPLRVISDPNVDAVIICSSTDTHADLIIAAAKAKKQIFCEKPIALGLDRIDAALDAVDKAGVKLQIGFNRRFDSNYRRVHDLIREGAIGDLHILKITSRDPSPPPIEYVKVSGGLFLDMMIHDFDMARYLTGSEVEEVYAVGAVRVDPAIGKAGDIDTAAVTLKFANGVIGTIDNSRKAVYGYDQRVEAFGSRGMADTANRRPNEVRIYGGTEVKEDLPLNFFVERYTESYIRELTEFVECVTANRTPPVTGLDGRMPVAIGYAAKRSYEEHRPVALAEIR
ncbi:MAG TPA: inositol 2-dehydrogenase [Spirochaetia bacterium]|nr:inositol 2-dehydrogenase [Spirochaetia bacterium]